MSINTSVSRRNFIKAAAGTTASASSALAGIDGILQRTKNETSINPGYLRDIPEDVNILFILSDQHRGDFLGNRGRQTQLKTPYLDMLAENGIGFNRGYTACPLCVPARPAYLTGKYPSGYGLTEREGKGKWHYRVVLDKQYTLPEHLHKHGYHTANFGKAHLVGETEEQLFGFQEREIGFTYDNEDYRKATSEAIVTEYLENGSGGYGGGKEAYNTEYLASRVDYHAHFDTIVVDRALDFMKRNKGRKWYLQVGLEKPHPTLYPPVEFINDVDPSKVVIPENWDQFFGDDIPARKRNKQRNNMNKGYYETYKDPETGEWSRRLRPESRGWTEKDVRNAVAAYIACINYVDHEIGRLLHGLKELGQLDKTLIVYASDHGEMCLDHGMVQKTCLQEGAINVPIILCGPGVKKTGPFDRGPAELTDLFPTYCDYLGIETPDGLAGRSLIETLKEGKIPDKDIAYCEYFWDSNNKNQRGWERAVVSRRWKYIDNGEFEPELYDLEQDPGENKNLAFDPKYSSILEQMREKMNKRKAECGIV
ncbi:Arylsulfatase [Limihaloglobus sulfuriphilus]|uniref:Arylsulfatase n=1 Tax=Limihaloglobus sulfuriphilus TaxID=1851148 RepID=A0A1Q2MDW8_9BACT|nr:sulfatase-like hydrolase/transferase [Limihaloglobus sulfuriphilus]AQQ70507.1 Arylsulfatase [Limihaloglobus sulfuriphilus]